LFAIVQLLTMPRRPDSDPFEPCATQRHPW
jgi:hypothetical protein